MYFAVLFLIANFNFAIPFFSFSFSSQGVLFSYFIHKINFSHDMLKQQKLASYMFVLHRSDIEAFQLQIADTMMS